MDTRLLMILQVNVAAPQNIGAVPHGTRRTALLSGGTFEGPRLRGTLLPDGSADWLLLRADGVLEMDLRVTLQNERRTHLDEIFWLAARTAGRDRGHRTW